METRYLSKCHANWVSEHPLKAYEKLATHELTASLHAANMLFDKAIPFYGYSFEIAEILLNSGCYPSLILHHKLALYGVSLAELYELKNQPFMKRQILKRAYESIFQAQDKSDQHVSEEKMLTCLKSISKTLLTPLSLSSAYYSSANSH
ncbi:MAG: hypothetical protein AAGJ37_05180 [Pseudomonadota bacterium]